jgi:tRNA1(Val) A37 N6-methylase TrmN6
VMRRPFPTLPFPFVASLPLHRYQGARVIELGAGPGLIGLMLAKLGAKVVITDIGKVLGLIQKNVELNELTPQQK